MQKCGKRVLTLLVLLLIGFTSTSAVTAQASEQLTSVINALLSQHEIERKGPGHPLSNPNDASNNSFTYSSTLIQPPGDAYIIITDHKDPDCNAVLERLANLHNGRIIHCDDFRSLPKEIRLRAGIFKQLQEVKPKYVAIAPRLESFTENVVLSFWQLLCNFGGEKINVLPAFLVAGDANSLQHLVDHSTKDETDSKTRFSAVTIAQSTGQRAGGDRAVRKAGFVSDLLAKLKVPNEAMIVRTPIAPPDRYPNLATLGCYDTSQDGLLHELSPDAKRAMTKARLLTLFGHGSPSMTCSVQVSAFKDVPFDDKVVLCGSCFSCYPPNSDLQKNGHANSESFFERAIENSARVFYGHMRENGGFPLMFVAMESLLQGESVGESYQRVLNTVVAQAKISTRQLIMTPEQLATPNALGERNGFLIIMIGDPAARPFATNAF